MGGPACPLLSAILCESMSVTDSQNHRHRRVNSDESQGLESLTDDPSWVWKGQLNCSVCFLCLDSRINGEGIFCQIGSGMFTVHDELKTITQESSWGK